MVVNDALNRVFVVNRLNREIKVFDKAGYPVATWDTYGAGQTFSTPYDLDLDASGNLYIADYDNYSVVVLDSDGNFLRKFGWGVDTGADAFEICTPASEACQSGTFGCGAGQFAGTAGVAVGSNGDIYVTTEFGYGVQVFDASGNFLRAFGWGVDTGA